MGMAASSLRLTSLHARKNQVEFEGQQINQQRINLSQKSSAIYNQMLEMAVPTAPSPSDYTKIVYKFDAGYGESQVLNITKKDGAYNYNIRYKSPATEKVLSKSTYNNVSFSKPTDIDGGEEYQYLNTNIDGESYQMELVGSEEAARSLSKYKDNLSIYENMKTIEEQIAKLSAEKSTEKVSSSTQRDLAAALGISDAKSAGTEALKKYMRPDSFTDEQIDELTEASQKAAARAYSLPNYSSAATDSLDNIVTDTNEQDELLKILNTVSVNELTWDDIKNITNMDDLAGLVYDHKNDNGREDLYDILFDSTGYDPLNIGANASKASQAALSLYYAGTGEGAINTDITNEDMISMLRGMLKSISATADNPQGYSSSSEFNNAVVVPSYTQYANQAAVAGMINVDKNQALYRYKDENDDWSYMYVPLDNVSESYGSTYADSINVYENEISYVEGRTQIYEQDANIVMSSDGQITKITFADGTVVQPTVTTEIDQDAYDFAMVEYDYLVSVYEKEMNDANAQLKIIQAQDQRLEVRLTQLDTEQKALSTEIDAVKSVRDKSIESSFKTFA